MATQPQQQSSSEEGSKENTILNGPRHDRERNAQSRPSKPTDERPQGSAPTAPTTWAGGPPQAPPVTNTNRNHQDPPEHNDTNGSTKAPTKGQGATKSKKALETQSYIEIAETQQIEEECRNWKHPTKMLPKPPESDLLVSPGDIKEVRKCMLPKSNISDKTCKSFCQLLDKYQAAFSNSSEDIGHTELITMDIDTGISQPVSQRPYTLPLKHHN